MSRILRRPMFRGGPVSSYGTGIAAPLVPGYQGGGQIGGGIIYGKPMADGRYGFADVTTGGDLLNMNKEQALKMAEAYGYTPEKTVDTEWVTSEGQKIYGPGSPHGLKPTFDLESLGSGWASQNMQGMDEYIYQTEGGDQLIKTDTFEAKESPEETSEIKQIAKEKNISEDTVKGLINEGEITIGKSELDLAAEAEGIDSDELVWQSDIDDNGQPLKTGKWVKKGSKKKKTIGDSEIDKLRAEIAQLRKDGMGSEGIAINKETYLEALGGAKARGEDISEMLLGFAGAEGDDTMSKLKSFFKSESQRKGRYRSLEDTAGLLAIKDHIAGKRSKESLAQLLGQLDYKAKLDKKSLGENIMKAAGPGSTPTLSNIKVGVKSTYPGVVIEDVTSTEGLEFEDSDEGKIFIETDTKTVYTIKDGAKKVLY